MTVCVACPLRCLRVSNIFTYYVLYAGYTVINTLCVNLTHIGPCIIVIVEEKETSLMSLVIKF